MTIAEKLTLIAENQQKVYDAGYEAGYEAIMPATINFFQTLEGKHLSDGLTAGTSTDLYMEDGGYCVHYYKFTKPVKGGQIQIEGTLANTFYSETYKSILVVCDRVVAINQSDLNVSPDSLDGAGFPTTGTFIITLPTDVSVDGIYLNGHADAPVCTYTEVGSATPKNPTFRVKFPGGAIATYEFEEGMTWTEWLGSEYNSNYFYDNGFGGISENYMGSGRWVYSEDSEDGNSISGDTVIEKDYQYVVQ